VGTERTQLHCDCDGLTRAPSYRCRSYGDVSANPADKAYMRHLKELAWSLLGGPAGVTLYTTDGGDASAWLGGCDWAVPTAS